MDFILANKITFYKNTYLKKVFNYYDIINYKSISFPMNLVVANLL